jgi:flagellar hook-associated protein 1 FlgK
MSIPSLQGLQTALSGLMAEQEMLDITGQNIANANTAGYSRETATLGTSPPIEIPAMSRVTGDGGQLGTGVSVESITRIRNAYLDAQYRAQNSSLGGASTQAEELQQAEGAFSEPSSSSLASQLSAFWSAWSNLADAPTSEPAKQAVISAGQQLTRTLGAVSHSLETVSTQAGEQYAALTSATGEVASYGKQIAQLNGQIRLAEQAGQSPNEMLDRRDDLLDKLSGMANVTVTKAPDGTDTVTFGNAAKPLVEGTTSNWPQELTAAAGGQLGALLEISSATGPIAGYQATLNSIAATLAGSVNALQPTTPFFSGTTAATLTVVSTAAQVQTSSSKDPGGNELALAVAALRGGAVEQSYSALVERVGSNVATAKDEQANFQTTLATIANQRQSVSGVSLDEEMTNLISYQQGYQASARTMTAMDSILETLIEHTGVVGL